MNVQELAHAARSVEWQERIRMCRSSGKSVTGWCAEHQISPKTYYRWERICLAEAAERLGYTGNDHQGLIKVNPSELSQASHNNFQTSPIATAAELVIRCGQLSLEINSGMPVNKIAELVSALNSHV